MDRNAPDTASHAPDLIIELMKLPKASSRDSGWGESAAAWAPCRFGTTRSTPLPTPPAEPEARVEPGRLFDLEEAARLLGGVSVWTLRAHVAQGTVHVTRVGRRVLIRGEEIERIRAEGLPSLRTRRERRTH